MKAVINELCSTNYLINQPTKSMAKVCQICGKGPTAGINKSHSNIKTKRKVNINLQVKKLDGQKKKVCTSCIKTRSKQSK